MSKIFYPGTFDPITRGHVDLIERASLLFDEVIVAVARSEKKSPLFSVEEREQLCREAVSHLENISFVHFSGLTVNLAKDLGCNSVLRGVRAVADYEYELQLANMNRAMMPEFETVFLTPGENLSYISSSLLREIAAMGGDVSPFVPANVMAALRERIRG